MPKTDQKDLHDFIMPLDVNGLQGRMLRLPMPQGKKREILLIYGHHASLERVIGLAELLNDFGAVTVPDLPGFGGMDSFYHIHKKPTLDDMADYMASFIKLRYRNRRFTVVAISFGFLVITRMLQKYPELAKKVDLLVSVVGFMHHDEFKFSKGRYLAYRYAATLFSGRISSLFFRNLILHPTVLRTFYHRTHNAKHKFAGMTKEQRKLTTEFEVHLWRINDARTHMDTSVTLLTVDNTKKKIDLPVYHLSVKNDNYFDNHVVEQHMRMVFKDYHEMPIKLDSHSVSVIASKKDSAPLVPYGLRKLLREDP